MEVVLEIPDKIATQLQTNGRTLRQRALEGLAIEAYRRKELSLGQFAELLDLSINDANGLLKERGIFDDFSSELETRPRKKQTLPQALGLLETSAPPPTDEETKQWLEEHRTEKYGVMRVLLDTNVVLDVLLNRQPWVKDAAAVWQANDDGRVMAYLTASTFTDIFYIARKVAGIAGARQAVRTCLEAFEICDVTRHTLQHAETLSGNDFEDNLQIACVTLQNMDAISTRDFRI